MRKPCCANPLHCQHILYCQQHNITIIVILTTVWRGTVPFLLFVLCRCIHKQLQQEEGFLLNRFIDKTMDIQYRQWDFINYKTLECNMHGGNNQTLHTIVSDALYIEMSSVFQQQDSNTSPVHNTTQLSVQSK